MKVLSIREPYASLICEKVKKIETRSWKTNYRGPLYIHSSLSMDKSNVTKFLKNPMQFGKILCTCELVDCVYMDEEFINKIKNENPIEYQCGSYEIGRYAWVLDNIEVLDKPIDAKGKLGLWNYE